MNVPCLIYATISVNIIPQSGNIASHWSIRDDMELEVEVSVPYGSVLDSA